MNHTPITSPTAVWTEERIASFWDSVAQEPRLHTLYFSRQLSGELIHFAQWAGLASPVLDYGCGPGYLSEQLVSQGYTTTALEFSAQSAARVNQLIGDAVPWQGCLHADHLPSPLPSDTFAFVFSIETYEHLRPDWIEPYFRELYRVTKPGGRLLLSTPSQEDLNGNLVICPVCQSKFHRWGHLRSVTSHDLETQATQAGFKVLYCKGIDLNRLNTQPVRLSWDTLSWRTFWDWYTYRQDLKRSQHRGDTFPHQYEVQQVPVGANLILIAEKVEDS